MGRLCLGSVVTTKRQRTIHACPGAQMQALLARKALEGLTYQQLADETGIPMSTLAAWGRRHRARSTIGISKVPCPDLCHRQPPASALGSVAEPQLHARASTQRDMLVPDPANGIRSRWSR